MVVLSFLKGNLFTPINVQIPTHLTPYNTPSLAHPTLRDSFFGSENQGNSLIVSEDDLQSPFPLLCHRKPTQLKKDNISCRRG
jgi:hypothetical protein